MIGRLLGACRHHRLGFGDEIRLEQRLTDLMAPLELGWKDRRNAELALMDDLVPLLKQRAQGQDISGLSGYED